jgi:hypothetical protein
MWALGCVIYNLCTLRPPFSAPTIDSLVLKIRRGQFDKRLPQIYSRNLMALVSHLIVVDPKKRLAAAGVLQMPEVAASAELLPLIPRRDHMHAQLESPSPTRLSAVPAALAAAEATAPESPRNVRAYRSPPPVRRRPSLGTQLATAHERTELSFGLSVERPGAPEPGRRDFEPPRSRSPALAHSPSLLSSSSSTTPLSSRGGSPPSAAAAAASSSSSSSPFSRGSPALASPTSSALAPGPRSVGNRGSQKEKAPSPSRATVLPALVTRKQPQLQQPQRLRERRNNMPEQPPPPPPPTGSSKRRAPPRSRSSSLTPLSPSESSTPEPPPAARSPKRPSHLSPMPPASPAHAAGKDAGLSPPRAAKGPYISRSPRRLLLPPMPSPSPLPGFDRSAERPLNKT